MNLVKTKILGVGVTNETEENILEYVIKSLTNYDKNYYIVTPNPEIIVFAAAHKTFSDILNNARLALCDGTGLFIASIVLGKKIKQRVTGVDFMFDLCKSISNINIQHEKKPITVGFLGGGAKIAERTAECLRANFPGLKVVFVGKESRDKGFTWSENSKSKTQKSKLQLKTQSHKVSSEKQFNNPPGGEISERIDILFVAFGFPKQEEWMAENINSIPVRVMVGVGGAFDYISGKVTRAPFLVRLFGFEWFWRLIRQPWRLKRQMALVKFVYLLLKEKLGF